MVELSCLFLKNCYKSTTLSTGAHARLLHCQEFGCSRALFGEIGLWNMRCGLQKAPRPRPKNIIATVVSPTMELALL